jgi:uroporphyrinogen-III synthase
MKLLIIRPEPGASASAARAKAAGFEPLLLPFFEVRARAWQVDDAAKYDALLLTSANAVRHAGARLDGLARLPVYCVGERTADAARGANLAIAYVGGTDAAEAVHAATVAGHDRLLWLAGEDHRPLAAQQTAQIDTVIVYASEALPLSETAAATIKTADAVALHSARAAEAFAAAIDLFGLDRSHFIIAAFSSATANAAGEGWRAAVIADQPQDSALLSALAAHGREQG